MYSQSVAEVQGASHFKLGQALVGLMIMNHFILCSGHLVSFRESDTGAGGTAHIFRTIACYVTDLCLYQYGKG